MFDRRTYMVSKITNKIVIFINFYSNLYYFLTFFLSFRNHNLYNLILIVLEIKKVINSNSYFKHILNYTLWTYYHLRIMLNYYHQSPLEIKQLNP